MKRKKQLKRVRKDIAQYPHSSEFYTDHILEHSSFCDFYFIGWYRGKEVVWNATLLSSQQRQVEEISDLARLKAEEHSNLPSDYERFMTKPKGKNSFTLVNKYPELEPSIQKLENQYIGDLFKTYTVPYRETRIHTDYKFGVGLEIYVPYQEITVWLIEKEIHRFLCAPQEEVGQHTHFSMQDCGVELTSKGIKYNYAHNTATLDI